jgi:ketosteroid isomerase-like protein
MSPPDPHRELVDRYLAAYNAFDVPGLLATLHDDVRFRNLAAGEITASADGIDEFRALAERAAALFSSRRQRIREYVAGDGEARIEVDYEGVLAADLGPQMRAGDTLRLAGRTTFGFRDGRIASVVDES